MFRVCESIAWGMEHTPFNAALLKTISVAFPNEVIYFYAEDSHLAHVREQIGGELGGSVVWRKLALPPRHSNFYTRLRSDFQTIKFLLNKLNRNPNKDVLVITGNASILWAVKHYIRNIHKDKKVQVVIHGDFSTLHRTPRKSLLNPFYYIGSLKTALKISGYERIQHIVLEETLRDIILKHMPFLQNCVCLLDHPVPVDRLQIEHKAFDPPIQFGYLGRATEKKGFSEFLKVASEISRRFCDQVKFHHVGPLPDKIRHANHSKMAFLNEIPGTEEMSRNEYISRLKSLHFVCLFHDKYYESCASGVLLDSISQKKPIIATKLPIFATIEQKFGDIGYLSEKNEFSETISSIIRKKDSERYKRQVINMSHVKESRVPETLAIKYLELVDCLYNQKKT